MDKLFYGFKCSEYRVARYALRNLKCGVIKDMGKASNVCSNMECVSKAYFKKRLLLRYYKQQF